MLEEQTMVAALVVVLAGVIAGVGGIPDVVEKVNAISSDYFTVSRKGFDSTFWITSVIITGLGAGFNTFPHLWPPVLAAKSGAMPRRNVSC